MKWTLTLIPEINSVFSATVAVQYNQTHYAMIVTLIYSFRRHDQHFGDRFGSLCAAPGPSAAISLFVFAII